jgi:hypothetical protein
MRKACRLIEQGTEHRVADLHIWRVVIGVYACIVTVATRDRISATVSSSINQGAL